MSGILRIEDVSNINILKIKNNLNLKVMELAKVLFYFMLKNALRMTM